ncbi:MAG: dTDP-4-dehydrorhamnose 3,5-epimerase [Bacilli bacterium]|jgi:dTDP-4-dehydrorhamnose 3,5-epimerase|nr:dTDP-4-dehydrorhamnose 3,5-epimerase [Bacilli bacterium]
MQKWNFEKLDLDGAYLITPFYADDIRGGFLKDYSQEVFEQNGIHHDLKEVFYTISHKGVIRAMHFQRVKQQAKLVRCVSGQVYDVIIDLRKDSPTFKKWEGFYLSDDNMKEILVPEGFGHGYLVLEDSIVSYKCAEKFYGEYDSGIRYDDPDMGINWPYDRIGGKEKVINSVKDDNLQSFKQFMEHYSDFLN